jgi:protein phosphatase
MSIRRQWECPPPSFPGQSACSVVDLPEPAEGARMLIVGDTHGQLADVLWIFAEYGVPSKSNVYLFNGDVADRGSHAVEVFALLFCFMLKEPGSVFLSRGNHENMEINERAQQYGGGFAEEVRSKYSSDIFVLFTQLFELLPLAFVVASKAF